MSGQELVILFPMETLQLMSKKESKFFENLIRMGMDSYL
jgi:hypothetical protein